MMGRGAHASTRTEGHGRGDAAGPNCTYTRSGAWHSNPNPASSVFENNTPREGAMKSIRGLHAGMTAIAVTLFLAVAPVPLRAQQVAIDADDIGGVVHGPSGPEAGVWVIAETTDLPTKFARMVVTDDQGRYVIPDLPKANYKVWVRGYGLVDSAKVDGTPGKTLDLTATPAPSPADAAKYYPAIYWYSMLKIPDASQFGGKGGIPEKGTQRDGPTTVENR